MNRTIGVCSWSLQPSSATELAEKVSSVGASAVQLALDPIRRGDWDSGETVRVLNAAGISIASGMMEMAGEDYSSLKAIEETGGVRPDSTWNDNLAAAHANAELAASLGLELVTFHAGFIPHGDERSKVVERIAAIADAFAARGVGVALETGQESADSLLSLIADLDHASLGVNFDPANMILYGMGDPIIAIKKLAGHIVQVHIKDADPSPTPGEWGTEQRAGTGSVDWPAFFEVLNTTLPNANAMLEREAGDDRVGDLRAARELAEKHLGAGASA